MLVQLYIQIVHLLLIWTKLKVEVLQNVPHVNYLLVCVSAILRLALFFITTLIVAFIIILKEANFTFILIF